MEMTIHIALETPAGFHLGQAVEGVGRTSLPSSIRCLEFIVFYRKPFTTWQAVCAQLCAVQNQQHT